jgi:hypothetical protein
VIAGRLVVCGFRGWEVLMVFRCRVEVLGCSGGSGNMMMAWMLLLTKEGAHRAYRHLYFSTGCDVVEMILRQASTVSSRGLFLLDWGR